MSVVSTDPTSRRGYLSQSELEEFANIVITDSAEADDVISQAEELIDAYIGSQKKFYKWRLQGRLSSSNGNTSHTLQYNHLNTVQNNYYIGCEMEIIGGAGVGQRRKVTASTYEGVVTTNSFTTPLDSTSVYAIYQLGKFPRIQDMFFDGINIPYTFYRNIPEQLKRAVAAQVQFIIQMGDAYFNSDKVNLKSENIGDYSYTKGNLSGSNTTELIAPKARVLLKGFVNRKGDLIPC